MIKTFWIMREEEEDGYYWAANSRKAAKRAADPAFCAPDLIAFQPTLFEKLTGQHLQPGGGPVEVKLVLARGRREGTVAFWIGREKELLGDDYVAGKNLVRVKQAAENWYVQPNILFFLRSDVFEKLAGLRLDVGDSPVEVRLVRIRRKKA